MTYQNNFCKGCGTVIDPSMTHCPYCGMPLSPHSHSPMGSAIKALGIILAVLLELTFLVLGISLLAQGSSSNTTTGFVCLFGGSLFTYAVTVLVLGFGRLVSNSDLILKELQGRNKK